MKKRFVLALLGLWLGLSMNAYAAMRGGESGVLAPDRVGHWDLGIGVAAGMNDAADDSVFIYGQASYGVTPYIGLGIEAGWEEADGERNNETVGVVPIMADIIIRVPTVHEALVPYGILGLGGADVYVDRDNLDDDSDTGFAWKLGAGFDYFINTNWIFNFEFTYWSTDVDIANTSVDDGFDWWTIGVALKYVF